MLFRSKRKLWLFANGINMEITKLFLHGLIHCAFYGIGFLMTYKLMADSEARLAYSYLTGWWTALYFGYIARFNISSSAFAFTIYFCVGAENRVNRIYRIDTKVRFDVSDFCFL